MAACSVRHVIRRRQRRSGGREGSGALSKMLTERFIGRIRRFELERSQFPADVQAATGLLQAVVIATPDELGQLRAEIITLMSRYVDRIDPALRPPDSQSFELVMFTHVLDVDRRGTGDAQADPDS